MLISVELATSNQLERSRSIPVLCHRNVIGWVMHAYICRYVGRTAGRRLNEINFSMPCRWCRQIERGTRCF